MSDHWKELDMLLDSCPAQDKPKVSWLRLLWRRVWGWVKW